MSDDRLTGALKNDIFAQGTTMIKATTTSTSIESAIRDAERFGATPDEARLVHRVVKANTHQQQLIKRFELKFDRDASDNAAVWVHLIVDDDLTPSPDKITRFNKIAEKVRSALLVEKDLRFWPYVDVRGRP
jgi:hypothetical protein